MKESCPLTRSASSPPPSPPSDGGEGELSTTVECFISRLASGNLLCCFLVLLAGCLFRPVTVSTRRFVLAPIPATERSSAADQLSVGVGNVKMPPYLLRSSFAVRKGTNEIVYLEDVVWGERLDRSFQQTLAANLSTLLPSDQVYLSSWERDQVKARLFVNVEQFDIDTEGRGTLIASWQIRGPDDSKLLKSGRACLARTGPAPRGSPQVIVTRLSNLVGELSRELAQAIQQSSAPIR